jgi:hypothetical protein
MGDPVYEAIRGRERAEAERERAAANVITSMMTAVTDFLNGKARVEITSKPTTDAAKPEVATGTSMQVRFVRDSQG